MRWGVVGAVSLTAAVAACGFTEPAVFDPQPMQPGRLADGSTIRVHSDVIVEPDEFADEAQLVEVIPPDRGVPATVHLAFEGTADAPLDFGMEGGVAFLGAYEPGGSLVADRIVDAEDGSVELPGGEYTLRAYYRSCSGNCSFLNPARDLCHIDVELVAGGQYDVTVTATDCMFQPRP